jgi:hypothetical protein
MRTLPIVRLLLPAMLATAACGQTLAWRELLTPAAPFAACYDETRQTTVLAMRIANAHLFEWDGATALLRSAPLASPNTVAWLGYDSPRRQRIAVSQVGAIGTDDGRGWRWVVPPVNLGNNLSTPPAVDTFRQRVLRVGHVAGATVVYEWDGTQWLRIDGANGPTTRLGAALAYDPIGRRTVLYGGRDLTTLAPLGDCWSWDGGSWTLLQAQAPPAARAEAAFAFDPHTNGLVLHGGTGVPWSTWQLVGTGWTQLASDPSLPPTANAILVPDRLGMLLLAGTGNEHGSVRRLVGGAWSPVADFAPMPPRPVQAAFDPLRAQVVWPDLALTGAPATRLFDTQWRAVSPASSPSPRHAPYLAWSAIDQQVLLWGGVDPGNGALLDDTWSWDGTTWTQRFPLNAPPPRTYGATAEDPSGGVALFGGFDGAQTLGDHWRWDGANWHPIATASMPGPTFGHSMVRDPLRNRVVMVRAAGTTGSEGWEWDGATWQLVATPPRVLAPLFFDPSRGAVAALGFAGLVSWDGSQWQSHAMQDPRSFITGQVAFVGDTVRRRALRIAAAAGTSVSLLTDTPATTTAIGVGCALDAPPTLEAIETPVPGTATFALDVGTAVPQALTFVVLGLSTQGQSLGAGCTLHVGQQVGTVFGAATAAGNLRLPVPIPASTTFRGVQFAAQAAVIDPAGSVLGTVTLSAGLRVTVGD